MDYLTFRRVHHNDLLHYGIKRRSGRYPYGSGERPFQGEDRRYKKGERMDSNNKSDSSVTRKVKGDYNNLSDKEFRRKYQTTKEKYRKRVNRYGDPYMNSPLAKFGKKMQEEAQKNAERWEKKQNNKEKKQKFSNEELISMIQKLNENERISKDSPKYKEGLEETRKIMQDLSNEYVLTYNVMSGTYYLRKKESQ